MYVLATRSSMEDRHLTHAKGSGSGHPPDLNPVRRQGWNSGLLSFKVTRSFGSEGSQKTVQTTLSVKAILSRTQGTRSGHARCVNPVL